jgi:hypothetical protein
MASGNWLSGTASLPPITSSAARMIASPFSLASFPAPTLYRAAHFFTSACASTIWRGMRAAGPEEGKGKFSRERAVCTP